MSTDLDIARVKTWLAGHLPGLNGQVEVETFSGGQFNPTYRLRSPAQSYVLRRKPFGVLWKSAHAVEREFRVQRTLWPTDVPVAKVHVLWKDEHVIDAPFYVKDEVPGRNFDAPTLPDQDPATRHAKLMR